MIRGGHRLWAAPEDPTRTYAPDNGPVASRSSARASSGSPRRRHGLRPPEGDRRSGSPTRGAEVDAACTGSRTSASEPTELAPWSLSVMAPGGVEIIPLPAEAPAPRAARRTRSRPPTSPRTRRWSSGRSSTSRTRAGTSARSSSRSARTPNTGRPSSAWRTASGGVGYLNDGTLFVKRFEYRDGQALPRRRRATSRRSPTRTCSRWRASARSSKLDPARRIEHIEHWELFGGVERRRRRAEIEKTITPKLK